MKKGLSIFIILVSCTVPARSSDQIVSLGYQITFGQLLATLRLPIHISNVTTWNALALLLEDLLNWKGRNDNSDEYIEEGMYTILKETIVNGFNKTNNTIQERSLVAIMFFIRSIDEKNKTIQCFMGKKNYSVGPEICDLIKDHLVFAQLIKEKKISCTALQKRFIYHPNNFLSTVVDLPTPIKQLARKHGPLFQIDPVFEKELNENLNNESQRKFKDYISRQDDPRYSLNKNPNFFQFPYERNLQPSKK